MRNLKAPLKWVVGVWSALIALFYLYTAVFGIMQPRIQRGIHMLFLLPMAFLLFPATKKNSPVDKPSFLDWVLALASSVPALYIIV
jgi:TRAP-type uncharacterized transport system fused permease subunit